MLIFSSLFFLRFLCCYAVTSSLHLGCWILFHRGSNLDQIWKLYLFAQSLLFHSPIWQFVCFGVLLHCFGQLFSAFEATRSGNDHIFVCFFCGACKKYRFSAVFLFGGESRWKCIFLSNDDPIFFFWLDDNPIFWYESSF